MLKGLYILDKGFINVIYGPTEMADIARLINIYMPPLTAQDVKNDPSVLKDADVIMSGWGCIPMTKDILDAAPNLKAVFYGAGSIKSITTEDFWDRGIVITSGYAANGIPVAEYTLSQVIFCLKSGWRFAQSIREQKNNKAQFPIYGAYGSTVGIISLGMVGRKVCELLKNLDVNVICCDPFADDNTAAELGVTLCTLEEVFSKSHVVSLHTPLLEQTRGMIRSEHFEMMKPYSSFINTSRGAVIRENEMIEVLKKRPDIQAVLDVTSPEPPAPDSPLYDLPNVVLTPHIAGSKDDECRRMGRYMVEELERYLRDEKLLWEITRQMAGTLA
ncbi:MAG: hydroxyacid dehydrogenase [Armatimonadota bacterium]